MKKRAKFLVLSIFALALVISLLSGDDTDSVSATDPVIDEISNYRNWNKITKEPVKVDLSQAKFASVLPKSGFYIDGAAGGG